MNPEKEIRHRLEERRDKVLHFRLTKEKEMLLQSIVFKMTKTNSLRKFMEEVVIPTFSTSNKQGIPYRQSAKIQRHNEPFLFQLKGCAKNLNQFMAFLNTRKRQSAVTDDVAEKYYQRISRILDSLKIIMESENYHIEQE